MPSDSLEQILLGIEDFAIQSSIYNLIEGGVSVNFIEPILMQLNGAVGTGMQLSDLIEELRVTTLGTGETLGSLERYAAQVNKDALSQFNATYNQALTQDLGLQFAQYIGGRKKDTRPFCNKYVGGYYHNKEIEDMGKGIDPLTGDKLNDNLFKGRIKTTNASNMWVNRGGWNCEHFFAAVETIFVPKKDILRAVEKNYYTPSKAVREHFGI